MLKRAAFTVLIGLWSSMAGAVDKLDNLTSIPGQTEFRLLSEDLAAIVGYKALGPAEPRGLVGFDIGVSLASVQLESSSVWATVMSSGDAPSTALVPRLHVHKGLPFDIDIGASLFAIPGSNIKATGAEVKYAFMDGGVALPAVAVRGAVSSLAGVNDLAVDTKSLDVSISKGILFLTPYAGIGKQWTESTPEGTLAGIVSAEKFSDSRHFIGLVISPGFVRLTVEQDVTGDVTTNSIKFSFGF